MNRVYHCQFCSIPITESEHKDSLAKFRYPLCGKHQSFFNSPIISEESMHVYFALRRHNIPVIIEYHEGTKTIDMAIPGKIYIEVDGTHHQDPEIALTDLLRSFHSWKDKIPTFRISNESVRNPRHFNLIIERLVELCKDLRKTG